MAVSKCPECGATISTLATQCTVCGKRVQVSHSVLHTNTRLSRVFPIALLASALALAIPVVTGRAVDYRRVVTAERLARERRLAEARERERQEQIRRMTVSADSMRRSLPRSRLRRVSRADLLTAISLVETYRADSGAKWLAAARRELARRDRVAQQQRRAEELRQERAAARRRAESKAEPYSVPSTATSRGYYRGPRGGCYTYSRTGRKRYVDRSLCN